MEKKIKVNHVSASSIGKLVGVVNAIVALASGIIGSVVAISAVLSSADYGVLASIGISAAIIAGGIIIWPLIAFAMGWIYGALVGFIWNVLLGASGGIEMTIENMPEVAKK